MYLRTNQRWCQGLPGSRPSPSVPHPITSAGCRGGYAVRCQAWHWMFTMLSLPWLKRPIPSSPNIACPREHSCPGGRKPYSNALKGRFNDEGVGWLHWTTRSIANPKIPAQRRIQGRPGRPRTYLCARATYSSGGSDFPVGRMVLLTSRFQPQSGSRKATSQPSSSFAYLGVSETAAHRQCQSTGALRRFRRPHLETRLRTTCYYSTSLTEAQP